ncbi:MAG: hypothetical protein R3F39_08890 [Myxococcota bacterium]
MRLRSRHRRVTIARRVDETLAAVDPAERRLVLDTLGEVALSLACRPMAAWAGSPAELAELTGGTVAPVSAALVLDRAADLGLLVEAPGRELRFRDADTVVWLAARRTAVSGDARGLGAFRLRGALFDVFAMAVAELGEPGGAPMVREMAAPDGEAGDLLELAMLEAAAACAWGAPAEPELRATLINCAAHWTGGGGLPYHRDVGAALLAVEAGREPYGQRIRSDLGLRVETTAHDLARPEFAEHPVLLAMLDAQLAGLTGNDVIGASAWAELAQWLGPLGDAVYHAVGRTSWPGSERDAPLLAEIRRGLVAGESRPLILLAHLDASNTEVIELTDQVLEAGLASPGRGARARCLVATRAIAEWEAIAESTVGLLALLVLRDVSPALRIAAARALAAHPIQSASRRADLLRSLEGARAEADPEVRSGIVGAALHLGSQSPEIAAIAVALVADGYGADSLPEALAEALATGRGPVSGLADLLGRYDAPGIRRALIRCLEPAAARLERAFAEGVHAPRGHDLSAAGAGLCRVLLSIAFELADPELAARAAMLMGWFGRGDASMASRFRAARVALPPGAARDGFAMALGALGSIDDATVEDLARDLATGPPPTVAAAAQALRWLVDGPSTAARVEPWVTACLGRAERDPQCRIDLLGLARHVATAPLLDAIPRRLT